MATETKTIGRIAIVPKGTYSPTITYTMLDVVYYKNSSYICNVSQSLGDDPLISDKWSLMTKGMYPVGIWDSSLTYDYLNLVTKTTSSVTKSYLCIVETTTQDPESSNDWLQLN